MHNEFIAVIERDGEWYIAYCPEVPGANGQGRTKDEARESLSEAIALILEDRRTDGRRGVRFGGLKAKKLKLSRDFHAPLRDDDLLGA